MRASHRCAAPEGTMRSSAFRLCIALLTTPLAAAVANAEGVAPEVQQQLDALARENAELRRTVESLADEVRAARDEARTAGQPVPARMAAPVAGAPRDGALLSVGGGRVQLLDLSLDVLASAGWSGADDEQLELLQGGGHDPRRRGFTLQQAELSMMGAVDPFFTAEAHVVYFIDSEGESRFELEEAFVTTTSLPFGLHERGAQLEMGQFFTEFGRVNPQHPHQWDWQDQPVVNSRFFGEDGMRGPGVRLGWLLPTPWTSEIHLGAQNANGETMLSFLASDEAFEERPIGGRPYGDVSVRSPKDLLYLARWVNGVEVGQTVNAQLGVSYVTGPNASGRDGQTHIVGGDVFARWRPLAGDRGWPFVTFQAELMGRRYEADGFALCADEDDCDASTIAVGGDDLEDWGFYAQALYGFRRPWAAGFRVEHAAGSGRGFDLEASLEAGAPAFSSREDDPFRSDRTRIAPLLVFYPSEFSRLRLQANYDWTDGPDLDDALSVWAGVEFLLGAHPAHRF
jgi:hypothetical protein